MTNRGQCSGSARSGDHYAGPGAVDAIGNSAYVAFDECTQLPQLSFTRGIVMQEFVAETNRAQRQADAIADVTFGGNGKFAAAAAQIDHQHGRSIYPQSRCEPQMNQMCFFQS